MMSFDEKRKHKRYDVENITGYLTFSLDVKVLNMSLDGMAVESSRMLSINKDYTVRVSHKDEVLNLTGKVVWSTLSKTMKLPDGDVVPVYRAGIKFKNVLNEKALTLIKFIENNRVLTLEKRVLGRFNLKSHDAHINYPHGFTVRKISLSGMLIESEVPLELDSSFDMTLNLNDKKEISIKGKVVTLFEAQADNAPYRVGIKFTSINDTDREILKDYIDSLLGD